MRREILKFSSHLIQLYSGLPLRRTTSCTRTGFCSRGRRKEEGTEVVSGPDFREEGQEFEDQDLRGLCDHAYVCVPALGLLQLRRGTGNGS